MHKSIGGAVVALFALGSAGAFAQQPPPAGSPQPQTQQQPQAQQQPQDQQQSQTQQPQTQQQANLPASADSIIGKKVMGQKGEEIGEINNVLVDKDGKVAALIVQQGGAMGLGGKQTAIQWDKVQLNGDMVTLNMPPEQVSQLPEYQGAQ